jgi:hypothetical protein
MVHLREDSASLPSPLVVLFVCVFVLLFICRLRIAAVVYFFHLPIMHALFPSILSRSMFLLLGP